MRVQYVLTLAAAIAYASNPEATTGQVPLQKSPSSSEHPVVSLHRYLVEHESVTGNEKNVATFLKNYLRDAGFTVDLQTVEEDRHNVHAYFGNSSTSRILLSSHIDTVPPHFPYRREGSEIWGRGSVDDKASVAAQVSALEALRQSGEIGDGDAALLFVVGEETNGAGMRAANDLGLTWESVIFGEPTELKLARGHKGGLGVNITAKGISGHSGYPDMGRSAIDILVQGLAQLQVARLPGSKEFGDTTLNVGTIEGGVAANVIPPDASAVAVVRLATYDSDAVKTAIRNAVENTSPWLEVSFWDKIIEPVSLDFDVPGFETAIFSYGTDIPNLQGDHERYLYGPGTILVAHSDHEHLSVDDLLNAVDGYQALVRHALKQR